VAGWLEGVLEVSVVDCAQAVVANAKATIPADAITDPMRIDLMNLTSGQP
jgi:hypothetical protein